MVSVSIAGAASVTVAVYSFVFVPSDAVTFSEMFCLVCDVLAPVSVTLVPLVAESVAYAAPSVIDQV